MAWIRAGSLSAGARSVWLAASCDETPPSADLLSSLAWRYSTLAPALLYDGTPLGCHAVKVGHAAARHILGDSSFGKRSAGWSVELVMQKLMAKAGLRT